MRKKITICILTTALAAAQAAAQVAAQTTAPAQTPLVPGAPISEQTTDTTVDTALDTVTLDTITIADSSQPIDISSFGDVRIWVAPARGGAEEDRAYFDFNFPEEVRGGGFVTADSQYNSDYYITVALEEDYDETVITMELYTTKTDKLIVTNSMGYKSTDDMAEWNLLLIYQLMANAPIGKIADMDALMEALARSPAPPPSPSPSSLSSPSSLPQQQPSPAAAAAAEPRPDYPVYRLYLGPRVGFSNHIYTKSADTPTIMGYGDGRGFEAGLSVSFQALNFLAVQLEAFLTSDGSAVYQDGSDWETPFTFASLAVPLTLKGTFRLGRFVLGPLLGVYMPLSLNPAYTFEAPLGVPLGITAGVDIGMHLGGSHPLHGILFLDARFSMDLGEVNKIEPEVGKIYTRTMVSVALGYRWGLFQRPLGGL